MRTHFLGDMLALTGRSLTHIRRSPDTIITTALMPVGFLLLFVFVFGGAIDIGAGAGQGSYVDYLLPGILIITIASGIAYTAYRLFLDMQGGIFERFQSMPIARSTVLWAHVVTSVVANVISLAVVIGVAVLMGFRSDAGVLEWLAVAGILVLLTLALTWIAVIPGLTAKTIDGASAFSYPLIFLPFLSSAFVPTESMPGPVRWFAENQPVTAIVDAVRAPGRRGDLDRSRLVRRPPARRLRRRAVHLPAEDPLKHGSWAEGNPLRPRIDIRGRHTGSSDHARLAMCLRVGAYMLPELTRCGLLSVDEAGLVADADPTILEWVGASSDEVVGQPVEAFLTMRLPLTDDRTVPADATLRSATGVPRPVVVGAVGPDGWIAVFDVSPGSVFDRGFRAAQGRSARGRQRLQILLSAATGFAEARSELQAAELLVDVARRAFAASDAVVSLGTGPDLTRVAGRNPLTEHWPPGFKAPGATTLERGEVVVVRSPEDVLQFVPGVPMDEVFHAAGVHAALASPIRHIGESLGVLVCFFDHPREFDEEAVPLAEALSNQAAQAIARIRLEETLRRAAMHDEVTGLPSRRLVEEEVQRSLLAGPGVVCALFIDLDRFKQVNDRLGHPVGDALLAEVAQRLRGTMRDHDTVGRFGGDEFIAVAAIEREADAVALAERVIAVLAQPYPGIPTEFGITASVGVVVAETGGDPLVLDQLVRMADHAMYEAKTAGGNRLAIERYPA
jgi:ABC transporter DrrB family efflux protein